MRTDYRVKVPEGKKGRWAIERFTVKDDLELLRIQMREPGRVPKVGETYTRLIRTDTNWTDPMMSDTPAEVGDHIHAIGEMCRRGGRVLINGLGIGLVLKAALACKNVTHVDVVEIEQDIIDLVGPTYADPRVQIHHADAFTIEWPKDARWTAAWHDIWPTICTDNLPEMTKLHRKYAKRVDWQGSWMREYLQSERRQERSMGW